MNLFKKQNNTVITSHPNLHEIVNNAAKTVKNLNCDTTSYFYNAKEIFKNAKTELINLSRNSDKLIIDHASLFFGELNTLTSSELNFTNMLINNISLLETNDSIHIKNINKESDDDSYELPDILGTYIANMHTASSTYIGPVINIDKAQLLQNLKEDKQHLEKVKQLLSELQDIYSESSENKIKEIKLKRDCNETSNTQIDYNTAINANEELLKFYIKRNTLLNAINNDLKIDNRINEVIDINNAEIATCNTKIIQANANKFLRGY